MKPLFLFPRYFNIIGWLITLPGLVLGVLFLFFDWQFTPRPTHYKIKPSDFTDETALTLFLTGLYLILFSRKKNENHLVNEIRLNALHWSFLINFSIVSLFILALPFNADALDYWVYNLFSMPLLAVCRFQYNLYVYNTRGLIRPNFSLKFHPYYTISVASLVVVALFSVFFKDLRSLFYFLPALTMLWFWCAERKDKIAFSARLKVLRLLFTVQILITICCSYIYYQLDFFVFMIFNLLLTPLAFGLILKIYQAINNLEVSNKLVPIYQLGQIEVITFRIYR